MSSLWDICELDAEELALIDIIREQSTPKSSGNKSSELSGSNEEPPGGRTTTGLYEEYESGLYNSLVDAELNCKTLLEDANEIIVALSALSAHYNEVTGRSNTLTKTCENLLEQQVGANCCWAGVETLTCLIALCVCLRPLLLHT